MSLSPDMATLTSTATSALPESRPAPPSGPLPALPVAKTRKPHSDTANTSDDIHSRLRSPSPAGLPASALPTPSRIGTRSVTASGLPAPKSKPRTIPSIPSLAPSDSSAVSSLRSPSPVRANTPQPSSGLPTPTKTLRKTTSFSSFPAPPKVTTPRVPSLPPSPLSTSTSLSDVNGATPKASKSSTTHRSADSGLKKPKSRTSGYGTKPRISTPRLSGTPSLLNGTADDSLISSSKGARGSESLLSLPSPPASRASSADGSYVTESTAFEEMNGSPPNRGRRKSKESNSASVTSKRTSLTGKDSTKGNVLVSVRVRPDSGEGESPQGEWMVDGKRALISYSGREGGDYRYDNVFAPHDNNGRVYDSAAKRLVRRVMEGYHGTVFAYGMTGTGKTFSMQGTATSPGVIPLAITDIFSYIRENPSREFLLRVSYLEIYNEKIYDLLSQTTPGQTQQEEIKLREDARRGVYATPLKEEIVQSPTQLLRVIARGDVARRTGSTQFNARSSRSHAVVQIVVESRERTPSQGQYFDKETRRSDRVLPGGVLVSTLSLIDLAGSEKAAESKERRQEGAHINKSLLTLGTVIGKLSNEDEKDKEKAGDAASKEKSTKHLPYRDSKLTRLLQPALSGNSLVSILCTVQLSSAGTSAASTGSHTGETLNTLKFASRAKNNIVSHAKRNESNVGGGDAKSQALLDRYRIEIQELRQQLEQQNQAKEEAEQKDELEEDRKAEEEMERQDRARHEEQMLEMQLARTALKERIGHLNRLILSSKSIGVNSGSGRMSSASTMNTRFSTYSTTDFGRPVSVRSRDSSWSLNKRDSSATIDSSLPDPNPNRVVSSGSIMHGILPAAQASYMITEDTPEEDDEGFTGGVDGEEHASLTRQNRMLQADLADKNRYIATLEKRLLQARRTSQSRVSMGLAQTSSNRVTSPVLEEGEPGVDSLLQEKDREIDELRAKLDDQMRMVTALRSAARKRDMLDTSVGATVAQLHQNFDSRRSSPLLDDSKVAAALAMPPPAGPTTNGVRFSNGGSKTQSRRTSSSRLSNGGVINFSKTPLSPISIMAPPLPTSQPKERRPESIDSALGSPQKMTSESPSSANAATGNKDGKAAGPVLPRRKSVDEMTMLLDQMIQEKVESGSIIHGRTGSLRIKRDTLIEQRTEEDAAEKSSDVAATSLPRLMDAAVLE